MVLLQGLYLGGVYGVLVGSCYLAQCVAGSFLTGKRGGILSI